MSPLTANNENNPNNNNETDEMIVSLLASASVDTINDINDEEAFESSANDSSVKPSDTNELPLLNPPSITVDEAIDENLDEAVNVLDSDVTESDDDEVSY